MKKLLLLLLTVSLFSCENFEDETLAWIHKAEKPIVVYQSNTHYEYHRYTLIAADGDAHYSHRVYITLPDTIY